RVGLIGLGNMGSGMARNLLKAGFDLVVHDVRREAATPLEGAGATWAPSARELASASDVVITMLPTPRHVESVVAGEDGVMAGLADGGTWVDMSTSVPEVANAIRAAHAARGIRIVDAPVSGMSIGAANGTLQIFIGGEREDVVRLTPVFEAM